MQHVAVVDDEEGIRNSVGMALEEAGFHVSSFRDGHDAWEGLRAGPPDLVVLDVLMPRMDGLELCRRLRSCNPTLPILFLSSRDEEVDRVLGLELGGDDYLCKPFSMRELLARVRVLLRRRSLGPEERGDDRDERLQVDRLELDLRRYTASWEGREVPLTVTEFRVLRALARRPGVVKTRLQLMQEGYPDDAYVSERTIDSHIKRIRRKFEAVEPAFLGVETVHGLGYRYRSRPSRRAVPAAATPRN